MNLRKSRSSGSIFRSWLLAGAAGVQPSHRKPVLLGSLMRRSNMPFAVMGPLAHHDQGVAHCDPLRRYLFRLRYADTKLKGDYHFESVFFAHWEKWVGRGILALPCSGERVVSD